MYPAIPCLGDFYMENGRWIVKSITKVWAVFHIESGEETSPIFDPFEAVGELGINDPSDGRLRGCSRKSRSLSEEPAALKTGGCISKCGRDTKGRRGSCQAASNKKIGSAEASPSLI